MNIPKILPCPFCGEDGEATEGYASCNNRGCAATLIKMPLAEWNKRECPSPEAWKLISPGGNIILSRHESDANEYSCKAGWTVIPLGVSGLCVISLERMAACAKEIFWQSQKAHRNETFCGVEDIVGILNKYNLVCRQPTPEAADETKLIRDTLVKAQFVALKLHGGSGYTIPRTEQDIGDALLGELDGLEAGDKITIDFEPVDITDEQYDALGDFEGH